MIYHTPEVVEQLESVGVPVLIERSSYESDPLGRIEWLKLYGALVGKEDAACAAYDALLQDLQPVLAQEPAGKTVAFFYITTSGAVNVANPAIISPRPSGWRAATTSRSTRAARKTPSRP